MLRPEEALDAVAFGLSEECRLKVECRGTFPYRWTVQSLEAGQWSADSTTGLLFYPLWRRKIVIYKLNSTIKSSGAK